MCALQYIFGYLATPKYHNVSAQCMIFNISKCKLFVARTSVCREEGESGEHPCNLWGNDYLVS